MTNKTKNPHSGGASSFPLEKESRQSRRLFRALAPDLIAGAAIVGATFAIQLLSGAFHCDAANDADEAAHLTTGIMVHEYLRTSLGDDPMTFAEQFYVRYPRVAFGHWPPVYYAVQSVWFFAFGPTQAAAVSLIAAATAATGFVLFRRLRQAVGWWAASWSVLVFLALPEVRRLGGTVMSDSLVSLCCLLAVLSYADFLSSAKSKHGMAFVGWSCLAILVKGSAAALLIFAVLAPLLACPRERWIWRKLALVIAAILAAGVPFYLLAGSMGLDFHAQSGVVFGGLMTAHRRLWIAGQFFKSAPLLAILVAAAGAAAAWRHRPQYSTERQCGPLDARLAVAWIASVIVFQILCPITGELRYFLPVLPSLALLFGFGIYSLGTIAIPSRPRIAVFASAAISCAAAWFAWQAPVHRTYGYTAVADSIPHGIDEPAILVSAGPTEEGAVIAARLVGDRSRRGIVLRASKSLGASNWFGGHYRSNFSTPAEIRDYLNAVPVQYIVLDETERFRSTPELHHRLLGATLRGNPGNFAELSRFPITWAGRKLAGEVIVYENILARGRQPRQIRIDMRGSLGRVLELKL